MYSKESVGIYAECRAPKEEFLPIAVCDSRRVSLVASLDTLCMIYLLHKVPCIFDVSAP
jgi:hypothetical protein